MKRKMYIILGLLTMISFVACEDLEVINTNQPQFDDVNVPQEVNASVGGLMNQWFMHAVDSDGPGLGLLVAADAASCSWGNFGMNDLSREPRSAFTNNPAYPSIMISEDYYIGMYATASVATDALIAMNNDTEGLVEQPARAKAMAKYIQGITLGSVGLLYDQGFVVTEYTDLTVEVPMVTWDVLIDSALVMLDEAIEIAENNTFTIPSEWVNISVGTISNTQFAMLANTMAARLLAYSSRTAAQNAANDWNKIKAYAEKGIDFDFDPLMDDVVWYDLMKTYGNFSGWARVDMRLINLMDPSMPAWFPASGSVQDLPNEGLATSDDLRLESDFGYVPGQDFRAERGIYHFTTYRYTRFDLYLETWTEHVAYLRKAENDMLLAEALVRTGSLGAAADILNDPANSRIARGGLAEVAANETALLDAIYYEKAIECYMTGEGVEFYDMRRRDMLQAGQFLHLPIPAQQLEIFGMPFYTFGGTQGEAGVDYSTGGWEVGSNRPNY
jgi:hypothetical protein